MTIAKVELKITSIQLEETFTVVNFPFPPNSYTGKDLQMMKSYQSLLETVRLKLGKKLLTHQNKPKPFKLSLHYFEAKCLHETMTVLPLNNFSQAFFNQLDQKLA